jgi:hypothetical protein
VVFEISALTTHEQSCVCVCVVCWTRAEPAMGVDGLGLITHVLGTI